MAILLTTYNMCFLVLFILYSTYNTSRLYVSTPKLNQLTAGMAAGHYTQNQMLSQSKVQNLTICDDTKTDKDKEIYSKSCLAHCQR